ncbi:MAG: ABC transporter substrate-binding protein [Myxococcota bacterium]|nr:ABC transporter substrate-binding protein [Myxococcota bacterium]
MRSGCRNALVSLVALALASSVGSCGPGRTLDPGETEPVRLGLVISLSGDLGASGQARLDAVRLAVREVNAAGGVLPGRTLELVTEDGESLPEVAARVAAEIVANDGVVGLIGDSGSSSTLRIYEEVTQPAGILHASGSSTSPLLEMEPRDLSDDGWFFRTAPSDDTQAPVLARVMHERGCTSVTIVYVANDYGTPFEAGMRARFAELGATVMPSIAIADGLADYSEAAMAVATAAPQCAALIAYPASGGRVMRAWSMLATRPEVRWFGADALRQAGFLAEAGDAATGFFGTASVTDPNTPSYNAFSALYEATFGRAPSTYDANFYDAAALMLLSIAAAEEADPAAMRAALPMLSVPTGTIVRAGELGESIRLIRQGRTINYEGASGPVDVDETGEIEGVFEVWRVDAGAFVRDELLFPDP